MGETIFLRFQKTQKKVGLFIPSFVFQKKEFLRHPWASVGRLRFLEILIFSKQKLSTSIPFARKKYDRKFEKDQNSYLLKTKTKLNFRKRNQRKQS